MNYRELGNTGMKVSEIGLGCEHLENQNYEVIESVIDAALAGGINIMDVFMSQPIFQNYRGNSRFYTSCCKRVPERMLSVIFNICFLVF